LNLARSAVSPRIRHATSQPPKGTLHAHRHHWIGRHWHSLRSDTGPAGIEATISNSRGPDSLKQLIRELGPLIQAGTREEAAPADIVFVAVNWTKLPGALARLPDWAGRIVIDATIRSRRRSVPKT
jgi:predicted dinucleotide-binding enzyme